MDSVSSFLESLPVSDRPYLIAYAFDQLMILFNLIGTRENLTITENNSEPISFDIHTKSEDDAINIMKQLNYENFTFGGATFRICLMKDGLIVRVKIINT